jgi:hypothetical protein
MKWKKRCVGNLPTWNIDFVALISPKVAPTSSLYVKLRMWSHLQVVIYQNSIKSCSSKAHPNSSYLNWTIDLQMWPHSQLFFPSKTWFLWFIRIFSDKNHLKFNISPILSPNLKKYIPLNHDPWYLSNNTKTTSQFF